MDGYEKVGRWHRFWIERHCRRYGVGLLVTAHVSVGLPDLCRTSVTEETASRVVKHLLAGEAGDITPAEIRTRLIARAANLREMLFDFYDIRERYSRVDQ